MFTDQAFVASSKAVSVLCRERKPDWQLSSNLLASRSLNGKVDCIQFFQKLFEIIGITDIGL